MDVVEERTVGARERRKANTRRALEEALRHCLAEHGYEETSVADVTRRAGVAVGTFYVHFESKEAALDSLLDTLNAELADRVAPALAAAAGGAPLEDSIRAAAEAFLTLLEERRWLVECYARRVASGFTPSAFRDGINPPVLDLLKNALEMYAARRRARADWDLVTHALLGLWLRVGLRYALSDDVEFEPSVDTLTHSSLGAVEAMIEAGRMGRKKK